MAIVVTCNAVDISAYIRPFSTLKIGRTFSFQVVEPTPYTLAIANEQEVIVTDGGSRTSGGRVKLISQADFNTVGIKKYTVSGTDYNSEPKASTVTTGGLRTASETDAARIAWLFTNFDTRGITVGAKVLVVASPMPASEDFTGMNLEEALNDICKLTGASWYIDVNKELHYFVTESNAAPYAVDMQSPNNTTTFPVRDFVSGLDTVDYYTDVYIFGNGVVGSRTIGSPPFTPRRYKVIRDQNITTAGQLNAVGDAFLAANCMAKTTGSFTSRRAGLVEGQNITIANSMYWGGTKTFRIQQLEPVFYDNGTADYKVTFGDIPPPSIEMLIQSQNGATVALSDAVLDTTVQSLTSAGILVGGANAVLNSSFENVVGSEWLVGTGWTVNFASATPFIGGGGKVARCVRAGSASGDLITDFILVDRTDDWWFSFWSSLNIYAAGHATGSILEYNAAGTLLATTLLADLVSIETQWTRHYLHFGPTAGGKDPGRIAFQATTAKIKLDFIATGAANLTWEIDGCQVERGLLISAYAPRPQELVDGQIGSTQLATDSVTTPKLIAGAVVTGKIATGAITTDLMAALAITADKIDIGGAGESRISIPNNSFEQITGTAPDAWPLTIQWGLNTAGGTPVHGGRNSLKVTMPSPKAQQEQVSAGFVVMASRRYRTTGWTSGVGGNNSGCATAMFVDWYDGTNALISSSQVGANTTVGSSTTWKQFAETEVSSPATTQYAKIRLRLINAGAIADVANFDDLDMNLADQSVDAAAGNVTIDSTGIKVKAGVISIQDQSGVEVMNAAGFAGPWDDFIQSGGVYNNSFAAGTIGAMSAGGGTVPYWDMTRVGNASSSSAALEAASDAGSNRRVVLKLLNSNKSAAPPDRIRIQQLIPIVDQFPRVTAHLYTVSWWGNMIVNNGGGSVTSTIEMKLSSIGLDKVTVLGTPVTGLRDPGVGFTGNVAGQLEFTLDPLAAYVLVEVGLARFSLLLLNNELRVYGVAVTGPDPVWSPGVGPITLTTTPTDILATDIPLIPGRYLVMAVCDFDVTTAGAMTCVGSLVGDGGGPTLFGYGGSYSLGQVLFGGGSVGRATVTQNWLVEVLSSETGVGAPGIEFFGLFVSKTAAVGVAHVNTAHTTLVAIPWPFGVGTV